MKSVNFKYAIGSMWDTVKQVRDRVDSIVKKIDDDLSYASKMTASELIENAVKYGCGIHEGEGIAFELEVTTDEILIKTVNRIINQEDYLIVKSHIDKISATDNPEALYISRLMELMENSKPGQSQLGLYRIAYEGEFMLKYELKDDILTVIATRKI
jgi:hypothetical protein